MSRKGLGLIHTKDGERIIGGKQVGWLASCKLTRDSKLFSLNVLFFFLVFHRFAVRVFKLFFAFTHDFSLSIFSLPKSRSYTLFNLHTNTVVWRIFSSLAQQKSAFFLSSLSFLVTWLQFSSSCSLIILRFSKDFRSAVARARTHTCQLKFESNVCAFAAEKIFHD